MALREAWTTVIELAYVALMGNRRLDAKSVGLLATSLVLAGAVLVWMLRRAWTDHNVSDPGVTL